jgi:hypothetical protein
MDVATVQTKVQAEAYAQGSRSGYGLCLVGPLLKRSVRASVAFPA